VNNTDLQCDEAYTKDNVIPINPVESAIPALQERLDRLKAQGLRHSVAKIKKDKKRKTGEDGDKAEKKRRNSTMRDSLVSDTVKLVQKITSQGNTTGDRSAAVASLFHTGEKTQVRWNDSFGVQSK
jgi:hypothetical protein